MSCNGQQGQYKFCGCGSTAAKSRLDKRDLEKVADLSASTLLSTHSKAYLIP